MRPAAGITFGGRYELSSRIAVGGIANDTCRKALPDVEFSDEDLVRLAEDFRRTRYTEGLRRALIGDRAMGIVAFENPGTWGREIPSRSFLNRNEDMALYLELMAASIAAAGKPFPQDPYVQLEVAKPIRNPRLRRENSRAGSGS